uniref:Ubiquitin-like protease family profile domain-containing protein n=1 Tax=Neogobius melanostomus TaxID=47308 RepID=A0A8C6SCY5_9GOBI
MTLLLTVLLQVINMYGELIMESADSKVHFLNSFFHKQLMDKGYEGVKRWTKQVGARVVTFLLEYLSLLSAF